MAEMVGTFVVIAEFAVSAEHRAEFLELCEFDSVRSTTDEAGCRQFDVVVSAEEPEVVILYERYDSKAAFDLHMATPHFSTFAEGLKRLEVATTRVRTLTRHYA